MSLPANEYYTSQFAKSGADPKQRKTQQQQPMSANAYQEGVLDPTQGYASFNSVSQGISLKSNHAIEASGNLNSVPLNLPPSAAEGVKSPESDLLTGRTGKPPLMAKT
mmetsp:Transcript_33186/g.50856  ORF Transcript_33186/g.50856 Transcript_33186/m.50856 type:complete len:108 (-) Transcript_33186:840-1163(-)